VLRIGDQQAAACQHPHDAVAEGVEQAVQFIADRPALDPSSPQSASAKCRCSGSACFSKNGIRRRWAYGKCRAALLSGFTGFNEQPLYNS
jgi:hypothetical protein